MPGKASCFLAVRDYFAFNRAYKSERIIVGIRSGCNNCVIIKSGNIIGQYHKEFFHCLGTIRYCREIFKTVLSKSYVCRAKANSVYLGFLSVSFNTAFLK